MAITTGSSTWVTSPAKQGNSVKSDDNRDSIKEMAAQSKQVNNAGILRAHEQVSLNSNNDSLSLLYKTALEGINAELEPVMGKQATKKIYDAGVDTSPDATADRIVSFATNFYSRYKEMNSADSGDETLNNFLEAITGGVEKGFSDAKDILKGLKVYEGEVENDVDKTYDLVIKGLDNFREKMLELGTNPEAPDNSAGN